MPRITVMMPVLNGAATVGAALRSTLIALPKDAEIVVWDDGSTDATAEVVARIAESDSSRRVRMRHSEVSLGGGVARRQIMHSTDSEWVASMDSDDVCLPWRFSSQLSAAERLDFCFAPIVRFSTDPARLKMPRPEALSASDAGWALAISNPFAHPTLLARRSAIVGAGGYRDLKVAQDYDLWLRASSAGFRLGRIAWPTLAYREHPTQLTRSSGYEDRVAAQPEIVEAYLALLTSLGVDVHTLRATIDRISAESMHARAMLKRAKRAPGAFALADRLV